MKVVIDAVGIFGHGGATVLKDLLHWLPKARPDWTWHVFLSDRQSRDFDDPWVAQRVVLESVKLGNSKWSRLLWINVLLQRRVRELDANVIFSFANVGSIRPARKQVVFCHQPNAFFKEANQAWQAMMNIHMFILRQFILTSLRPSTAVIVQTKAMKNKIIEFYPSVKCKTHIIPSGYSGCISSTNIRSSKKILIDQNAGPQFVYVSAVRPPKNHMLLLKAFSHILRVFPKATLLLTADLESTKNAQEKALTLELQNEAKRLSIKDRVVWLGLLNKEEVGYVYCKCDMLLFPSLTESFGLPLVEAMSENCLIAASDLPYAHDVLGDAAVYFDPNDEYSIAETVVKLLQSEDQRQQLLANALKKKKCFEYQVISEQIISVLA